jgi:hypothetical protein
MQHGLTVTARPLQHTPTLTLSVQWSYSMTLRQPGGTKDIDDAGLRRLPLAEGKCSAHKVQSSVAEEDRWSVDIVAAP